MLSGEPGGEKGADTFWPGSAGGRNEARPRFPPLFALGMGLDQAGLSRASRKTSRNSDEVQRNLARNAIANNTPLLV